MTRTLGNIALILVSAFAVDLIILCMWGSAP